MIPLRRCVRGPDRSPFASLPFSYFPLQTYCKTSFEDCNSLPKILQRVPRKSYCERRKTTFLSLVTRNPAQIKHWIEFVWDKVAFCGVQVISIDKKCSRKIVLFPFRLFIYWLLIYKRALWRQENDFALSVSDGGGREVLFLRFIIQCNK